MVNKRISNAFEVVTKNQKVKVKVLSIIGSKISLTMKDIDQVTGKECEKRQKEAQYDEMKRQEFEKDEEETTGGGTRYGKLTGILIQDEDDLSRPNQNKTVKRKSTLMRPPINIVI